MLLAIIYNEDESIDGQKEPPYHKYPRKANISHNSRAIHRPTARTADKSQCQCRLAVRTQVEGVGYVHPESEHDRFGTPGLYPAIARGVKGVLLNILKHKCVGIIMGPMFWFP